MSLRRWTLRHALLGVALLFGVVATTAMFSVVALTSTTAAALAENARTKVEEDVIAARLIDAAYAQQLAAARFMAAPSPALEQEFQRHGEEAFRYVRQYLFLPLPLAARIEVERIKEAHERFEVAARRAFDATQAVRGGTPSAEMPEVSARALAFSAVVRRFVTDRNAQHQTFAATQAGTLQRLERVTLWLAISVIALALLLGHFLRRVVLRPLHDFEQAAKRLGAGDAAARVPEQSLREFALVADSFNSMADHLHESHSLVEEKNRELSSALVDLRLAQLDVVQHEKLSSMGEMLAGLSHELNNPLAAILSTAEVLQIELGAMEHAESRRLGDELAVPLVRESKRARDLVRSLLNFSRRSDGGLGPVDLAETIGIAVGLRSHAFTQARKTIVIDVPDRSFVVGDAQKLQVAVVNILNNSLDALQESAGGDGVAIRARRSGEWIEVIFEDDGPGFQAPARIFEPFYTTKAVGRGTGLGLALVHRFALECGGSVVADNRPEGGARLTLRLRAVPVAVAEPPPASPALASPAQAANSEPRQRVLVVEDEDALRLIQVRMLAKLGVEVLTASSGEAAQKLLLAEDVDLVISDLRMPGKVDGLALLQWLSTERPLLAANLLVVTGDSYGMGLEALSITADRVLAKPFELADYMECVEVALGRATPV